MKTLYKMMLAVAAAFTFSGCMAARPMTENYTPQEQTGPDISINLFYNALRPYGQWISYGNYGRAWVPRISHNFRPYATNGHWVYSYYGWTWMSGYHWGWAPFHYGRWTYDNYYGWVWIPGTVWAPAWVAWRHSSSYYGWAPLGPGMNINIHINIPARRWVFVPRRYIAYRNIYRYYRPWRHNTTIINNTTVINNVYEQHNHHYFSGPTRRAVQQVTQRRIRPVRVFNSSSPSSSGMTSHGLRIYRPTISQHGDERTTLHRPHPVKETNVAEGRRKQGNVHSRSASRRPSSGKTSESRRPKATPPARRIARPQRSEQQTGKREDRKIGNNARRPSNPNTRSQRRTPARTHERKTIQHRRPPQRRSTSSRSQRRTVQRQSQPPQRHQVERR